MGLPLDTLAAFSPITPVTPFTYRDTATNMTILREMERKINALVDAINEESSNNAGGLNAFKLAVAAALTALRVELVTMIEALEGDATALDPTNGTRTEGVSKVIGRVYDYTRIFAYFARQYDELDLTAAEYDALDYSARHFDLGVTYPTLNDTQI